MRCLNFILILLLAFAYAANATNLDFDSRIHLKEFVTSEQRIRSNGYPANSYFVETTDGYILNLFRIPYSPKLNNAGVKKPAILLQHGLFSNSDCYLANGPDYALAYLLSDAGYDVWLGNARGNIYSRRNSKMTIKHPKFWQFSWHEIGVIDIPAMIDFILAQTGEKAIHYAGHSQGTTVYFVLMSQRPEYNNKIKTAHMLAPCAFFEHGKSFVFELFAPLVGTPGGIWNQVLGDIELMPQNKLVNRLLDTSCGEGAFLGNKRCQNMYLQVVGDGYENVNQTALQMLLETHPAGASSNQGIHYIQLYASHKFRLFDYGTKKNKQIYQQDTPPDYDLSKITARTHLYSSQNDALCVPEDVDMLVSKMKHLTEDYRIPLESFNHLDFIASREVKELLNDRIVRVCNEYEGKI